MHPFAHPRRRSQLPRLLALSPLVAVLALLLPSGAAAFDHDEILDGDLSGDRFAPTFLSLAPGPNEVALTSGSASGSVDRDYFTFVVPEGWVLDSVLLLTANVDGAVSFIGVQAGPVFSEPPTGTNVGNLLGWHHFGGADAGTEILDDLGTGAGSQGFLPPLGGGQYTFWTQDFGFQANFSMRFNVAPVPEPAAGSLLGPGLLAVAALGRRRASDEKARGPRA